MTNVSDQKIKKNKYLSLTLLFNLIVFLTMNILVLCNKSTVQKF